MICLACPEPVWAWTSDLPDAVLLRWPQVKILCATHSRTVIARHQFLASLPVWPKCSRCEGDMYLKMSGRDVCARCTYVGPVSLNIVASQVPISRGADKVKTTTCDQCDKVGWLYPMRGNVIRCEEHKP